jgi:choline dehydrogenase-like flavoprotein
LSGIGRPEILSGIGVDVKVALPGVGENIQEHINIIVTYEISSEYETADFLRDPAHTAEAIKLQ